MATRKKKSAKKTPARAAKKAAKTAPARKASKKAAPKKVAAKKAVTKKAAPPKKAPAKKAAAGKTAAKKTSTKTAPKTTAAKTAAAKKATAKKTTAKKAVAAKGASKKAAKKAPAKAAKPAQDESARRERARALREKVAAAKPKAQPKARPKRRRPTNLIEAAERAAKGALRVKPGERTVILTDTDRLDVAEAFAHWSHHVRSDTTLLYYPDSMRPIRGFTGQLRTLVTDADMTILLVGKHDEENDFATKVRAAGVDRGRLADLAALDVDQVERLVNVNYAEMQETGRKIIEHISGAREVRVTAPGGTDVTCSVRGRRWVNDNGDISQRGHAGTLPTGECYTAPVEQGFSGPIHFQALDAERVDGSVTFDNGRVSDSDGAAIGAVIKALGRDPGAKIIGEIGLGTNPNAVVSDHPEEGEKAYGVVHFAIGNSGGLGTSKSKHRHVVFVEKATVIADGVTILRDGVYDL